MYGKQTEYGIAILSRLSELYALDAPRVNAAEIAKSRNLQAPFVAKVLTALSLARLVKGTRGPKGGYALARPPADIMIRDVWRIFERENTSSLCPFGGGVCGAGTPCALHEKLVAIQHNVNSFLDTTNFEDFRRLYQDLGQRPTPTTTEPIVLPRASYRSTKSVSE